MKGKSQSQGLFFSPYKWDVFTYPESTNPKKFHKICYFFSVLDGLSFENQNCQRNADTTKWFDIQRQFQHSTSCPNGMIHTFKQDSLTQIYFTGVV